jgi:hypothetical protein
MATNTQLKISKEELHIVMNLLRDQEVEVLETKI